MPRVTKLNVCNWINCYTNYKSSEKHSTYTMALKRTSDKYCRGDHRNIERIRNNHVAPYVHCAIEHECNRKFNDYKQCSEVFDVGRVRTPCVLRISNWFQLIVGRMCQSDKHYQNAKDLKTPMMDYTFRKTTTTQYVDVI